MPLKKLVFKPGVNREATSYANEGGWFASDKIRFRSGQAEKIGGWVRDTGAVSAVIAGVETVVSTPPTGVLWGIARAMWNWITLSGLNLLAIGTSLKYYIQSSTNGSFYDVTPIRLTRTAVANAFTTFSTTQVRVNDPAHGAFTGDFVTISGTSGAVNGISAATMNAEYQITYLDSNSYYITVPTPATSSGTSAVTATFAYQLNTGGGTFASLTGWGAGVWGGIVTGVSATNLNGGINSSVTTITVGSTASFSATGAILIDAELIEYTGTSPTTFTGCTRGVNGTIAAAHNTAEIVQQAGSGNPPVYTFTGWGVASTLGTIPIQLRLWSQSNFGENLIFNPRGGAIYYWYTNTNLTVFDRGVVIQPSTTASGTASSITTTVLTVGGTVAGTFSVGMLLSGTSVLSGTYITSFGTGSGGAGTYNINQTQNVVATTITGTTNVNGAVVDSTCPSLVNYIMVSDASRFVIAFGCNDPTGVYASTAIDPMQIRWSDQESYATWTPAITNQAGDYRLSRGSAIITAVQTRQEILVITDSAIYSMQYLGAPYVWGFQIMGDNISIASPNAAVTVNNITYWMGKDKFYAYSGRVQTLPSTLREYVFTDINLTQNFQIISGTNEGYNEVWWHYCSANSNVIDRYVIYNHLDEVWYYGTWDNVNGVSQGRTAWLDSPLRASPMAVIYGTAGSGENALLVYHENGTDDNVVTPVLPISAFVTSSDFDIDDGHNYGFVWRAIPDLTFDGSFVNAPTCTLSIYPRNFPGSAYKAAASPGITSAQNYQTVRTYAVQQFTPEVYARVRGRQLAFQISSDTLGVQWQMGNMRIDLRADGRKA
jgi:hypothetical protein